MSKVNAEKARAWADVLEQIGAVDQAVVKLQTMWASVQKKDSYPEPHELKELAGKLGGARRIVINQIDKYAAAAWREEHLTEPKS